MPSFEELGLSRPVLQAVAQMGFEAATPIQEKAIPAALTGRDIIGQAQTGTGKTAAFAIPMIEKIAGQAGDVQGLVVAPTRELTVQVAEEINSLGRFKGVRALPIYGGQDIARQIRSLQNRPQVVVATPGRLLDHVRRGTVRLRSVSTVVLDEADEMLDMGFIEDIESILAEVPGERQTMLFSATMPGPIQELARKFMRKPEFIGIEAKAATVPNTDQSYIVVHEKQKFDVLCRLLDMHSPEAAIVFGRTKRRVDELHEGLTRRGYSAEAIHGDFTQSKRDNAMRKFREGHTEILVATDVAARGLDITGVTHVYNFDIPQDADSYVHRIGRTGRLGRPGAAVTLVTSRELGHLELIERSTRGRIMRKPVPTLSDAMEGQQRLTLEKLAQVLAEGDLRRYREPAMELLETADPVSVVAAALKLLTREPDTTPVNLTAGAPYGRIKERPARQGHPRRPGGGRGGSPRHSPKHRRPQY